MYLVPPQRDVVSLVNFTHDIRLGQRQYVMERLLLNETRVISFVAKDASPSAEVGKKRLAESLIQANSNLDR